MALAWWDWDHEMLRRVLPDFRKLGVEDSWKNTTGRGGLRDARSPADERPRHDRHFYQRGRRRSDENYETSLEVAGGQSAPWMARQRTVSLASMRADCWCCRVSSISTAMPSSAR